MARGQFTRRGAEKGTKNQAGQPEKQPDQGARQCPPHGLPTRPRALRAQRAGEQVQGEPHRTNARDTDQPAKSHMPIIIDPGSPGTIAPNKPVRISATAMTSNTMCMMERYYLRTPGARVRKCRRLRLGADVENALQVRERRGGLIDESEQVQILCADHVVAYQRLEIDDFLPVIRA